MCEVYLSALLLLSWFGVLTSSDLQAQERIIAEGPACRTCSIQLRPLVTINIQKRPPITDGRPFSIAHQNETGKFVVLEADLTLHVYDSHGKADRELGRRGRGPGEFQVPMRVFAATSDTLLVIDPVAERLHVIAPNGAVAQSLPFLSARPFEAISLSDGMIFLNAVVRDRDHIGYPLHLVTRDGQIKRSFGADVPDYRHNAPPLWRRRLSPQNGRCELWTARELEYVLEQWGVDNGLAISRLRRLNEWFGSQVSYQGPTPTSQPSSYVAGLRQDSKGLLWVALAIPDNSWSQGIVRGPDDLDGTPIFFPSDYRKLYDSLIEVIDPVTETVFASTRFDQYILGFIGDTQVVGYQERGNRVVIEIYEVRLIQ